MSAHKQRALLIGCGYTGVRLAQALLPNFEVTAVVRTEVSRETLRAQEIPAIAYDLDTASSDTWPLRSADVDDAHLFYLAPPPNRGVSDARLDKFLRYLPGKPASFVYISTTGVYGNTNGELVDESAPVNPQTDRAQRRMSAEHMTRIWCVEHNVRRIVLRVPGIYGPGRIAVARLERGDPFVQIDEAGVTNRIHVDDLVSICIEAATNADARGVYNATDGNSISSTEFMRRVAAIARLPMPVEISFEEARLTLSAERLSYLDESRRVSNHRMLHELAVKLRYGDVDAGIRASL
jgi:nucleoside-diphosphate-sugar epimerase